MPRSNSRQRFKKLGRNLAHIRRCLTQGLYNDTVNSNWLILDSCSTISCAKNDTIVSNVTVSPPAEHLQVYCNGGHMDTLNIPPMSIYVNDKSMANILSIKKVEN